MKQTRRIAIGLGSNLGDRLSVLKNAAQRLVVDFLGNPISSSIYETPPWGVLEQPPFLNAVIVGESEWKPPGIVNYMKELERDLGRTPGVRFGPRLIDLDLLVFGEEVWETEGVTVPHPRMGDREFVLRPLAECWPEWRHPILHRTAAELLGDLILQTPSTAKVAAGSSLFSS